mmetsp:Transcript_12376/g.30381  ORF Transcript_12376/g.30381 Transcript_12376/m.30381 type:complete len:337 (-) Transcript_12376:1689-2699(-)
MGEPVLDVLVRCSRRSDTRAHMLLPPLVGALPSCPRSMLCRLTWEQPSLGATLLVASGVLAPTSVDARLLPLSWEPPPPPPPGMSDLLIALMRPTNAPSRSPSRSLSLRLLPPPPSPRLPLPGAQPPLLRLAAAALHCRLSTGLLMLLGGMDTTGRCTWMDRPVPRRALSAAAAAPACCAMAAPCGWRGTGMESPRSMSEGCWSRDRHMGLAVDLVGLRGAVAAAAKPSVTGDHGLACVPCALPVSRVAAATAAAAIAALAARSGWGAAGATAAACGGEMRSASSESASDTRSLGNRDNSSSPGLELLLAVNRPPARLLSESQRSGFSLAARSPVK